MKVPKKLLLFVLPAGLIAAFGLALRPHPVAVDLGVASRGPFRVTLDGEGETRVRQRFVISAPFAGRILRIDLEPGAAVAAGQELATLRPATPDLLDARRGETLSAQIAAAEAALGRARARREQAKAELRFVRSDLARTDALGEQGIVSRQAVEAAHMAADSKVEALAALEFEVKTATQELAAARASRVGPDDPKGSGSGAFAVRSPAAGVVLRRLRESESVVAAGEPLLEVGDAQDLEVIADLLSSDAAQLRPGQAVEIEHWGGDATLHGRVERIEPAGFTKISALGVEEKRVWVVVALTDPPARRPGLGDGYRVELKVVVWQGERVLQVPASSLFRDGEGWVLFTLEDGRARRRRVEVGRQNGLQAEIRGGLAEGARVILHPGADVKDGVKAEERDAG